MMRSESAPGPQGRPTPTVLHPRRSRREVESIRAALQGRVALELPIADTSHGLDWASSATSHYTTSLAVSVGGATFDVLLDDIAFCPSLALDVLAGMPTTSRTVCVVYALAELIERVEQLTQRAVAIESLTFGRFDATGETGLPFTVASPGSAVKRHGVLVPRDAQGWSIVAEVVRRHPGPPMSGGGELEVARLLLGGSRVSTNAWRAVGEGWAVLITAPAAAGRGFRLVGRGRTTLAVCVVSRGECSARCIEPGGGVKLTIGGGADAATDAGDTEGVDLEFEIGRIVLDAETLRALVPGVVVDLDRPIEDCRVEIRCGGRLVGMGELLDLDGALAVRIVTLRSRG